MATHSSTLAWKIPWTEEPGGLQSVASLRVGHNWVTSLSLYTFIHWRRKWQATPVFLPGESRGQGSLVGCRLWGHTESDTTVVTWQQQQSPIGAMSLILLWGIQKSRIWWFSPKTWLLLIRQTLGTYRKSQKSIFLLKDCDHLLNTYCVPGTMLFALCVLSWSITVNNLERFLQILFCRWGNWD